MKLQGERLELIAAAYVLGTLRGGARRRLETLARQHPEVRLPGVSASNGTPTGHEIWLVAEDVRGQQLLTRYTLAP